MGFSTIANTLSWFASSCAPVHWPLLCMSLSVHMFHAKSMQVNASETKRSASSLSRTSTAACLKHHETHDCQQMRSSQQRAAMRGGCRWRLPLHMSGVRSDATPNPVPARACGGSFLCLGGVRNGHDKPYSRGSCTKTGHVNYLHYQLWHVFKNQDRKYQFPRSLAHLVRFHILFCVGACHRRHVRVPRKCAHDAKRKTGVLQAFVSNALAQLTNAAKNGQPWTLEGYSVHGPIRHHVKTLKCHLCPEQVRNRRPIFRKTATPKNPQRQDSGCNVKILLRS